MLQSPSIYYYDMSKVTDVSPIGTWPTVARSYEIALLGGFSISIVFTPDYTAGWEDYKLVKRFFGDVRFVPDGDMHVEMHKPHHRGISKIRYETLADIHRRVLTARNNHLPTEFANEACDALLRNAADRLELPVHEQNRAVRTAAVIAQLGGSTTIGPEHMAEGVMCCKSLGYLQGGLCYAERGYMSFGNGIDVALHTLTQGDVSAAITYLQSLYPND